MSSCPPGLTPVIHANGEVYSVDPETRITDFLHARNLPPSAVVVEHNGRALPRSAFPETVLENGDRLEIVKIVAGG